MQLVPYEIYKKCFSSVNEDENQTGSFNFQELLNSTDVHGAKHKFNVNRGDSIYCDGMLDYCKEHQDMFTFIAEGSSRMAFLMKDGKCLKIAKNEAGVSQNKQECKTFSMKGIEKYSCFPKLFDADRKNYRALIEEFGTKIPVEWAKQHFDGHYFREAMTIIAIMQEIIEVRKCKIADAKDICGKILLSKNIPEDLQHNAAPTLYLYAISNPAQLEDDNHDLLKTFRAVFDPKNSEIIAPMIDLLKFYQDHGHKSLMIDDLMTSNNWALCHRNGQDVPVIIDAGLSDSVWNKHYS